MGCDLCDEAGGGGRQLRGLEAQAEVAVRHLLGRVGVLARLVRVRARARLRARVRG